MRAVIEMKDVNKRFGNKEIFRSVSLDIEEGSTVGFVGENGSGKSVLFQIMAGLIPVDSGTVTVILSIFQGTRTLSSLRK